MIETVGGISAVEDHVAAVGEYLYDALSALRHSDGRPIVHVVAGKHHLPNRYVGAPCRTLGRCPEAATGIAWKACTAELSIACRSAAPTPPHSAAQPLPAYATKCFRREVQGSTVNFELLASDGEVLGYKEAAVRFGAAGLHIRTGCTCNPGACYNATGGWGGRTGTAGGRCPCAGIGACPRRQQGCGV